MIRPGLCGTLLGGLVLLGGCGNMASAPETHEIFDEQTGATISVTEKPLVFAYSRPELAANLRDYVSLVAASVNRSGKTQYWLVTYVWSTVDRRDTGTVTGSEAGAMVLAADDRRVKFPASRVSAHEAGIDRQVLAPKGFKGVPIVYRTDLPTLRFIATSRNLALLLGADDNALRYELWDDARSELSSFVQSLTGTP